jgi:hypothetical protein
MARSLEGGCEPRHGEVVSVKAMRQARCSSKCSTALPVSHDHQHALVPSIAPIAITAFIEYIFGSYRLKYGSLMSAAACMLHALAYDVHVVCKLGRHTVIPCSAIEILCLSPSCGKRGSTHGKNCRVSVVTGIHLILCSALLQKWDAGKVSPLLSHLLKTDLDVRSRRVLVPGCG